MAIQLGIGMIATTREHAGTIRRVTREPPGPVKYPYLVVSEKIEDLKYADIVVVQNFGRVQENLKKKIRVGAGLEIQVAAAREMDSKSVAIWLAQVRDLYRFCKLAGCQLILSSGATSPWSMVSGRSLDALLEECGIEPKRYWADLEGWLKLCLARRVNI
jgi:RNase P/RNase MRP subunit p30